MKGFTKFSIISIIGFLLINYVYAQTSNTVTSRHSQKHGIEKKSRHEKHYKESPKDGLWSKLSSAKKKTYRTQTSWSKHHEIHAIKLHGNHHISSQKITTVILPYINLHERYITKRGLTQLSHAIEKYYMDNGYLLPVAHASIKDSTLVMDITEGKIKDVLIILGDEVRDQKALRNNRLLSYIKKIEEANPLTTKDLERYILLINKIHGYSAEYEIEPLDSIEGNNVANLAMKISTQRGALNISTDNNGTKNLGQYQFAANAHLYNLLFHDSLILNATTSNKFQNLYMITAGYLNRLNSYGTSASILFSHLQDDPYDTSISKDNRSTLIKGRLDQYLVLNNDYSIKLEAAGEHRDMLYYINSTKSQTYSYWLGSIGGKVKIVDVFNTENWFYPRYDFTTQKVSYAKGSAKIRDFNKNFSYFVIDWYRTQHLFNKFSFLLHGSLQYTPNKLPLEHQYSIGSHNTAKGYEPGVLHADSGISGNTEFRYTQELPSKVLLESFQIFGFYGVTHFIDHNKTEDRKKHPGNVYFDRSTFHGAGAGVRLFFNYDVYAEGTASHPLNKKMMVNGVKHINNTIFRFLISKDFKW